MTTQTDISVIVPVCNGADFVEDFVGSIKQLRKNNVSYEVIIVDNLSDDQGAENAHRRLLHEGVRCHLDRFTDSRSSYAARNRGVEVSRGTYLAFTDFDCMPAEDWLERLWEALSECDIVAGNVKFVINDRRNYWEQLDSSSHMQNHRVFYTQSIATANLALSRNSFVKVGQFKPISSGADFEWSKRAVASGNVISFRPEVIVFHPTRKTFGEIRKKMERISRGDAELRSESLMKLTGGALRILVKLPFLPKSAQVTPKGFSYFKFRILMIWIRVKQLITYIRRAMRIYYE